MRDPKLRVNMETIAGSWPERELKLYTMSKLHVISRGRKKRGTETAQVVIKTGTTSITRHLQKIGGVWADKYGAKYELPS